MSEDLLPYFLAEGRELVERAGEALAELEQGINAKEAIEQAFRAIHTLKGSTALFDLNELGALLHAAENELDIVRRRGGVLTRPQSAALAACASEAERWIDALEAEGAVPPERRHAAAALETKLRTPSPVAPAATAGPPPQWTHDLVRAAGLATARSAIRFTPDAEAYFRGEDPLALIRAVPDLLWLELDSVGADVDSPFVCALALRALSGAPRDTVAAALRLVGDQAEVVALEATAPASVAIRTVRVEAASLDAASDLLDQLIIAKNALADESAKAISARRAEAAGVAKAQFALDRATAALHDALGRMRLAPLRRLFAPLPRQVREMAEALGKSVELSIAGEEVAVDKAIMDGLYEPLIHLLRNAVDHGIETPEARLAAGKPALGRIEIASAPRGEVAEIAVTDDGAGLDLARIRAVAVDRGLISAEAARTMSDEDAADLIFASGFSTARKVTEISGRGVGLDAVRAALARIGGRVRIESRPGRGAVVRLIAPLRTVLTRVAVLCVGATRFGAPLHHIREIVRVRRANITAVRAGEAIVVRDEVVPLMRLGDLVGEAPADIDPLTVLVIETAGGRIGVAVDRVEAVVEAPIQAASPLLSGLRGVTGAILQGDGRILLLLDLSDLTS